MNQVATRLGHAQVAQLPNDGTITTLYNWYFTYGGAQYSLVLYYATGTGVKYYNQNGGGFGLIFSQSGAAGSFLVGAGSRIYGAFYNSSGQLGMAGGQVYGWGIGADMLFAPPFNVQSGQVTFASISSPLGNCTTGTHGIAFLTTTRNGYTGILQPQALVGGVFLGLEDYGITLTTPSQMNLSLTFTSLPTYLQGGTSLIQMCMTTAANPFRWFTVPGVSFVPVVGVNTFSINISDDELVATGTEVTDRQNMIASINVNTPPFNPLSLFKYSSRLGYCTIDQSGIPVVYVSNQNDFQFITADQHGIYLEGQAIPIAGVSLGGVLYIAATTGFYRTVDSGDVPALWSSPTRVDGSVGIISPTCLLENSTSGYVIVASPGAGLYIFGGSMFPQLPLSYHQKTDWDRINWSIPTQVQLCEDVLTKKFLVMAPLNCTVSNVTNTNPVVVTTSQPHLFQSGLSVTIAGVQGTSSANATGAVTVLSPSTFSISAVGNGAYTGGGTVSPNAANAVMSWDYTEGNSPDELKYSLRSFTSFLMGAIGRVFNLNNSIQEVWYAPSSTLPGCLIRQVLGTEVSPYRDVDMSGNPAAIDGLYQTSNLPGSQDESTTLHDYAGAHLRVKGNGSLNMVVSGLDGVVQTVPARSPLSMSLQAAQEVLVRWFLRSEQQTIQFGTNTVDSYFIMSLIRAYYTESLPQR